jgi:ankyrin repeat protein
VTPLHSAAALLLERTAAWLLDHGADVNARSKWNESPLDVVGCGRGYGKTGTPEQVQTMTRMLLARGAQRTVRWAVMTGNAEWLRARHAEGTLGNHAGEGPLSLAVTFDRPELLALLLDLGYDPDERRRLDLEPAEDSWGQPLRNCAESGKLAMAEMLLARGADPNAHIYASGTPLFVAYGAKNVAMVELLERHGGYLDAEMVGWLGLTDKAKQMLADEAAAELRREAIPDSAEGQPVAELLLIGGVNHPEILQLALPRVERARDDPWWAGKLDESCGRGEISCLRMLLERCDVAVCAPTILHDLCGDWPLSQEFRPEEERVPKATLLLDAGARLDARDEWNKSTPLGTACRTGRIELVKLFLDRGADPAEADAEPWATPRAWAAKMGHADVLKVLQEREH